MTAIAILLALVALAGTIGLQRRVDQLERALAERPALVVHPRAGEAPTPPPLAAFAEPEPEPLAPPAPPSPPPAPERPRISFESLIGGRLPIWIGGAALVLAGFFLVRYSIESGLIGPAARTILAALFGLALVAASEAARRVPAIAADPRIGQVLAGAGIASLYGTLYMAAALYHLMAPLTAFLAVVIVTAAALAMALRHGPPTAVMALIGGFVAPLLAGFDAAGIAPLLVYLALLIAALFGLAIQRGWSWLALAASVSGFAWINFLLAVLQGRTGDLSALGAFTMVLAACASAALPATGTRNIWLRLAPLVAGCFQLLLLAPALDFGALAWGFYLVLAAAALFLAWRDTLYLPGALAALVFLLALEALALLQPAHGATAAATILATLLFALPGHLLATRSAAWGALALGGTAGPLLVANAADPGLLPAFAWGALQLVAAAAAAHLAWRHRGEDQPLLTSASAVAALLLTLGLSQWLPAAWLALSFAAAIAALALWARHTGAPSLFVLPAYAYAAALAGAALPLAALVELILAALVGDRLPYLRLPALAELFRALALPTVLLLATLFDPRQLGRARRAAGGAAIAVAILLLYALAKQPLAIADLPRFTRWGFLERALLTQACFAAAWALHRYRRLPSLAAVLLALALFRTFWFDLLILNPTIQPQRAGAAFPHLALAAAWLWTMRDRPVLRWPAALLTIAAALALVRQATHGTLLTGGIGTAENGGYSAVLLGIALFWLWRGIAAARRDLRMGGLILMTLVTFKVFLIDAAALDGVLRILSFLGLGIALIGIGWAYSRFLGTGTKAAAA